ncbi:MAG: OmpA family protein [Cyclobacteriaceae bacterium]
MNQKLILLLLIAIFFIHDSFCQQDPKEAIRLSSIINTAGRESYPVLSPMGKLIFFTRQKSVRDDQDIWISTYLGDNNYSIAKKLQYPINDRGHNSLISLPNYNTLIMWGAPDKHFGVRISNRIENGWSKPKDFFNRKIEKSYGNISVGNDLRTVVFGEGGDLFVTFNENGEWSEPKNLGNTINTGEKEDISLIAADNATIYFISNGHGGFGGQDFFMSKRLDDSWTNWSKPANLGPSINSKSDEYGLFVPALGEYVYFTKKDENKEFSSNIYRVKLDSTNKPQPTLLVKGKVLNAKTKAPIQAKIIYKDLVNNEELGSSLSEPHSGTYEVILPAGRLYEFYAEKEKYYPVSKNIDLRHYDKYEEISRDLELAPLTEGIQIRLNNLFFSTNSSELDHESLPELDRLLHLMKKNLKINIKVNGHTDNVGPESVNQILSENRAKSVVQYLSENGIDEARLSYQGFGESQPVDDNNTETGRKANRRVEYEIKNLQ